MQVGLGGRLHLTAEVAGFAIARLPHALREFLEAFGGEGGEEGFLGGKVAVRSSGADAGSLGGLADAQRVEALFGKQVEGRIHQAATQISVVVRGARSLHLGSS
ncbi:hypothetical protein D3C72_2055480 [compost metagenome]